MSPAWGHLCLSSLLTTAPGSRHTDAPETQLSISSCASDLCAEYLHRLRSEYYQLHTSSFGSKNSHFVQFEKAMKPTDLHLSFSLADNSCSNKNIVCGRRVYPGLLEENIGQTQSSSAAADPGRGGVPGEDMPRA